MKHKIFVMSLLFLFSFSIAQERKEKSCAGGCCGGEKIAMADMQDHHQHKSQGDMNDGVKKDTTAKKENKKITVEYTCPMHPEVKSDKPGKCPKCKMDLVEVKKKIENLQAEYTCPMHAEVKSDKPGKCPKCGMALVEVKKKETSLEKKKMNLMMAGKYNCCIEEPCNVCVEHGGCNCKNAVKNDKPVCGECYEGWQHGKGDVSGKSAKDIKKGHTH